jgi:hypothetical protein
MAFGFRLEGKRRQGPQVQSDRRRSSAYFKDFKEMSGAP